MAKANSNSADARGRLRGRRVIQLRCAHRRRALLDRGVGDLFYSQITLVAQPYPSPNPIRDEVTATYFYIPLYWKCFFTSTVAAIIARLLFSWYHLIRTSTLALAPALTLILTFTLTLTRTLPLTLTLTLSLSVSLRPTLSLARYHLSEGGHLSITSMLYADDLSTDPKQILAYVLIGMMSGGGHAHQPCPYP